MRSLFLCLITVLFSSCSGLFISEHEERMMNLPSNNRSELEELAFLNKEFARMNAALYGLNRQMEALLNRLKERDDRDELVGKGK